MVSQKRQFLRKNHKSTSLENCKFFGQAVTGAYGGNRGGDTRGYKRLQGGTKGYKGLEGVGGERKIWKPICQKST